MVKLSEDDFKRHLYDQIHLLKKRVKEYDDGDLLEAKSMSVHLRNILHDTTKSTSALTHLNKKDIKIYDTSYGISRRNILPEDTLICHKIEVKPNKPTVVTIRAPFDKGEPSRYTKGKIPFEDWWNNIIIDDKDYDTEEERKGHILSRKQVVLTACNQDGGAHIDKKLRTSYATAMTRNNVVPTPNGIVVSNIIAATIRQIAYEVLKSLEEEFPECF